MKNTDIYGAGLSNSTVRRIHMILHEALECAVREGLIPANPTDGTTLPKIIRKEKTVLKKDELEKLIKVIEKDEIWYDFFYTEVMTDMRRGEICGLKWSDFDETNGKRISRNIYAPTEQECEEKLKVLVAEMKEELGIR